MKIWHRSSVSMNRLIITIALAACCGFSYARPVVGLVTDFGLQNEAVGLCKGAIARVNSDVLTVDLTHNVESYSIKEAALVLRRTTVFPKGSVFVCVVDPGVGTKRRAIGIETKQGYRFVGPDNGVFSLVAREQGIAKAIELDPKMVNPDWKAGTFDGRDLFSPAGAVIATSGTLESAGHSIDPKSLVMVEIPTAHWDEEKQELSGEYLRTDHPFGNVWTNITSDDLTSAGIKDGDFLSVTIGKSTLQVPFALSFGHVPEGKPLAYLNSDGTFSLAINMGNFQKTYAVESGDKVTVKVIRPHTEVVSQNP